jgi:subfamily B ATP-binding cassette protein MsbA
MTKNLKNEAIAPADLPTMGLVRRLVREYLAGHIGTLLVAAVAMVLVAGATAAYAWLMQPLLDDILLNKDRTMLIVVPFAVFGVAMLIGFSSFAQTYLMGATGQRIVAEMQTRLFAHQMRADLAYFHNEQSGKLVSNFLEDANLLRIAVARAITGISKDVLMLMFLTGLMIYRSWEMTLVVIAIFPIAIVPVRMLGARMRVASRTMQERTGSLASILSETFLGARQIKAYGREEFETDRAKAAINQRLKSWNHMVFIRASNTPVMEALGGVAVALIIYYGGSQVIDGAMSPGDLFSFITALLFAYQPMKSIANLNAVLQEGLAAAQRIFALMDASPEIADRVGAKKLVVTKGTVEFENVTFQYGDGRVALSNVSLSLDAGRTAALVGPSGGGKTSLLNLIPRFYDVTDGRVLVDGMDVRDATLGSLRDSIALVSQEAALFNGSVRDNIEYGRAGASNDEIIACAQAAAAHDFVTALPDGYDTLVGEGGALLSGGQRQRITIARAMLKDAPILLLDEATSALDTESERQVQVALARLMKNRTTLVVAHRLSTVSGADIIYAMNQGLIVESGTHAELLIRDGLYNSLYSAQYDQGGPTARPPQI